MLSTFSCVLYFSFFLVYAYVLSTQMALLRLSADILYVGTQKDILGLKFAKTL